GSVTIGPRCSGREQVADPFPAQDHPLAGMVVILDRQVIIALAGEADADGDDAGDGGEPAVEVTAPLPQAGPILAEAEAGDQSDRARWRTLAAHQGGIGLGNVHAAEVEFAAILDRVPDQILADYAR